MSECLRSLKTKLAKKLSALDVTSYSYILHSDAAVKRFTWTHILGLRAVNIAQVENTTASCGVSKHPIFAPTIVIRATRSTGYEGLGTEHKK